MNRTGNVNQKLLLVLGLVSLVFFGLYTLMNFSAQRTCLIQERQMQNKFLAETIFTGFKIPMARGDVEAIAKQMTEFAKAMADAEIHYFGSDRLISFSTVPGKIGQSLSARRENATELDEHLEKLLTTGSNGDSFLENLQGNRHLSVLLPSTNEMTCHHCHGESRKVLGGLLVRQNAEEAFCRVEEILYRNVLLGIVGFIILLVIQYKSVAHLVITPIQNQVGEILTCAGQVEREAGQIESSSRHLSDGTTSLAASAQETSASVTEVAGNIRKNAEYSGKLDTLMQEHGKTFNQAEKEMGLLGASMKEVNTVTIEMKKIIRTIDEIAF